MAMKEIKIYRYYFFSSRNDPNQVKAVIQFWGDDGYLGAASFYDDAFELPPAMLYPSGVVGLNYHMSEFAPILDMLRNEKPVFIEFNGELNSRLTTSGEPVGEGEVGSG
jgi:hypothetical protein